MDPLTKQHYGLSFVRIMPMFRESCGFVIARGQRFASVARTSACAFSEVLSLRKSKSYQLLCVVALYVVMMEYILKWIVRHFCVLGRYVEYSIAECGRVRHHAAVASWRTFLRALF